MQPARSFRDRFLPDWFLVGMVVAIFVAWLFPAPGAAGGVLQPELLTKAGIAVIFFMNGVLLSFAAMRAGIFQWRAHMLIQGTTYLLFPLIGFALLTFGQGMVAPALMLGFFFLCALPSTVSSSVAMTSMAKGNVPVAVFNATLSSIIGIALTPLWVGLVLQGGGVVIPMGSVIVDLLCWVVMPLVIGQLLRPWLGAFAQRHRKWVSRTDRSIILLLVYTSFCDSFMQGIWVSHDRWTLALTGIATGALFFTVLAAMLWLTRALRLSPALRSAVVFCGSKKSLATGVPMAHLMFAGDAGMGLILLPIMLYHPLQMLVCVPLANRWGARSGL